MTDQQNPPASAPDKADELLKTENVDDQKVMALLSYLIWPIPLIMARDKPFVLFHLRQATLLICVMIPIIVLSVIGGFLPSVLPLVFSCISMIVGIGVFVLAVIGMINAWQGVEKPLPIVGGFVDKLPFP